MDVGTGKMVEVLGRVKRQKVIFIVYQKKINNKECFVKVILFVFAQVLPMFKSFGRYLFNNARCLGPICYNDPIV